MKGDGMRGLTAAFVLVAAVAAGTAAAGHFEGGDWRHSRHHRHREDRLGVLEIRNGDERDYSVDVDYDSWSLIVIPGPGGDVPVPPGASVGVQLAGADWTARGDGDRTLGIAVEPGGSALLILAPFGGRDGGLLGIAEVGGHRRSDTLFHRLPPPGPGGPPRMDGRPRPPERHESLGQALLEGLVEGVAEGMMDAAEGGHRRPDHDRPPPPREEPPHRRHHGGW